MTNSEIFDDIEMMTQMTLEHCDIEEAKGHPHNEVRERALRVEAWLATMSHHDPVL